MHFPARATASGILSHLAAGIDRLYGMATSLYAFHVIWAPNVVLCGFRLEWVDGRHPAHSRSHNRGTLTSCISIQSYDPRAEQSLPLYFRIQPWKYTSMSVWGGTFRPCLFPNYFLIISYSISYSYYLFIFPKDCLLPIHFFLKRKKHSFPF